jgi:hypothetical protein
LWHWLTRTIEVAARKDDSSCGLRALISAIGFRVRNERKKEKTK